MTTLNDNIKKLNDDKLINVTLDSKMKVSRNFMEFTNLLPSIIDEANNILSKETNLTDEKEIKQINADLHDLKKALPIIKKGRKAIKQQCNDYKETLLAYYDNKVQQNEIEKLTIKLHQRQLTIESNRKTARWNQLRPAYETQLNELYPELKQFSEFTFTNFQNHNNDLVSGAMTKKVTDKTIASLNNRVKHLYDQYQLLQDLKDKPQMYQKALDLFLNYQDINQFVAQSLTNDKQSSATPKTKHTQTTQNKIIGGLQLPDSLNLNTTDGKLNALYLIMTHLTDITCDHDTLLTQIKNLLNE